MSKASAKLWLDPEADYLEVVFVERAGYWRETANDHVMTKVDAQGEILGFSVLGFSTFGKELLEVVL
jgi:hypothetical protein